MQAMKKFYDIVYKIVMTICKLLLIADILITTMAILGRYISFIPDPSWSEEMVLTLMSYMAVLSAALAIRRKAHIRMTSFDKYLPEKLLQFMDLVADLAVCALAVVMLIYGWQYVSSVKGFYPSIPTLSIRYKFYPIPLAGVVMIIFELEQIIDDILVLGGKEAKA
ncbi:MAG: TRAP transporter small permease [Lachnospiraceae bacterium]|nr:TRAP transporter small permease [Lachnospiraceae bacterium]